MKDEGLSKQSKPAVAWGKPPGPSGKREGPEHFGQQSGRAKAQAQMRFGAQMVRAGPRRVTSGAAGGGGGEGEDAGVNSLRMAGPRW